MKANELMIGDWVQIVSDAPTMANEYHRIDWIKTGEVGLDNRKIVTYPYIQPIPLTAEILEKNGFSRNGLDIALFDRKGGDDFVGAANLQYVHELQYILRLCGIEKEIKP
jgi:hypothetical protein